MDCSKKGHFIANHGVSLARGLQINQHLVDFQAVRGYIHYVIHRHLTPRVLDALSDTPVVYIQGARQTGKSTLVQAIARGPRPAAYYSLDSATVLSATQGDPDGFIAGLPGPAVIDEVQRAPGLALAIKAAVDAKRTPGRFLLTGSASALALPRVADSLAGRMELLTLWPFSQGELEGIAGSFPDRVFADPWQPPDGRQANGADALPDRLLRGGYPDVLGRKNATRRDAWFESYLATILQRDVRDITNIENLGEVPRLLALLASRSCSLINYADLARSLAIPQSTLKRYMALLETTFLVRRLPAWSANLGSRLIKSPKLLLSDTGLLSHLLGLDQTRLANDRTLMGHVLENFVAMEVVKQLGWSKGRFQLFHFRAAAGHEVDLLLEDSAGNLVGIEIKAGAKVEKKDFAGLRFLAELTGKRFRRGLVLYAGDSAVPFGNDLHAVPVSWLWKE